MWLKNLKEASLCIRLFGLRKTTRENNRSRKTPGYNYICKGILLHCSLLPEQPVKKGLKCEFFKCQPYIGVK